MSSMVIGAKKTVDSIWFQNSILGIIVFSAILIGLDTSKTLTNQFGSFFEIANQLILGLFIIEASIKITSFFPRVQKYFHSGWNIFDLLIIIACLIPSTGEFALLGRLLRLARVFRLVSAFPELRLIVDTLMRSIPSMFNVVALMSIIFYVYAIAGYHLFHESDPTHWRSLGISLLSLFRIVTLEDWTDIMYIAMDTYWWAWLYFVSFVIVGTFVIVNLFIAVVINNLDEAKEEQAKELDGKPNNSEIVNQFTKTVDRLDHLVNRMEKESK